MKIKIKYFILMTIIFQAMFACSAVRENPTGEQRILFEDNTRKNRNTHSSPRPISTVIWYPAKQGTDEKKTNVSNLKPDGLQRWQKYFLPKLIPGSELLIIPNAAHYTFLNNGTIFG